LTHPDVDPENFEELRALKQQQPSLRLLLSIGGSADRFSAIAASPKRIQHFVDSCVHLAMDNGFDGLDIDWEHPVNTGIPIEPTRTRHPEDRLDYVLLLKAFRSALDHAQRQGLLLTAATAGYYDHLADFDLPAMAEYLNWFNLMIYDMSDMNPYVTADSSPLYEPSNRAKAVDYKLAPSSANYAVKWYLAHGVEAQKIVLGVPFYGHEWTGVSPRNDGLFEAYKTHVTTDDPLPYHSIQSQFPSVRRYWDEQSKASWLYEPSTRTLVSFDDERALTEKAHYVDQRGLGGIMFWDLTEDTTDFHLLRTLVEAMRR
jgi:chitinase